MAGNGGKRGERVENWGKSKSVTVARKSKGVSVARKPNMTDDDNGDDGKMFVSDEIL